MTKLIQDCLTELKNNEEARERFNEAGDMFEVRFLFGDMIGFYDARCYSVEEENPNIIQTLLSRVQVKTNKTLTSLPAKPVYESRAVMEFLDVVTFNWVRNEPQKEATYKRIIKDDKLARKWLMTLDHLLYREFTEALRVGTPLETALEIINKIYIDNL